MTKPSTDERITVVTAANNTYLVPMTVMLHSLLESLPEHVLVDLRILTQGPGLATKVLLDTIFSEKNLTWQEIIVDPSPLSDVKIDGHVTLETYFRILIPHYVQDVNRVLYLDADLVVCQPVLDFYHTPFDGAHLLAVPHISKSSAYFAGERGVPSYASLGIPGNARTFNAGVMLLNLDEWRRTDTTARIIRYLKEYRSQVLWWDQDALNAVLYKNWGRLHPKWNVMTSHFAKFKSWQDSLLDETTYASILEQPGIIHYSFVPKPWDPEYSGPFTDYWHQTYAIVAPYIEQLMNSDQGI